MKSKKRIVLSGILAAAIIATGATVYAATSDSSAAAPSTGSSTASASAGFDLWGQLRDAGIITQDQVDQIQQYLTDNQINFPTGRMDKGKGCFGMNGVGTKSVDALVTNGIITQDKADAITNFVQNTLKTDLQALESQFQTDKNALSGKTQDEMQQAMTDMQAQMKAFYQAELDKMVAAGIITNDDITAATNFINTQAKTNFTSQITNVVNKYVSANVITQATADAIVNYETANYAPADVIPFIGNGFGFGWNDKDGNGFDLSALVAANVITQADSDAITSYDQSKEAQFKNGRGFRGGMGMNGGMMNGSNGSNSGGGAAALTPNTSGAQNGQTNFSLPALNATKL